MHLIETAKAELQKAERALETAQRAFEKVEAKQAADVAEARAAFDARPTDEQLAEQLAITERRAQIIVDAARKKLDAPTAAVEAAQKALGFEERVRLIALTDVGCAHERAKHRAWRAVQHLQALAALQHEARQDALSMTQTLAELARLDGWSSDRQLKESESHQSIAMNWLGQCKQLIGPVDFEAIRKWMANT